MLPKSFIVAAAAAFSLATGVTGVAIEQPSKVVDIINTDSDEPPKPWGIDDTANNTADGFAATKFNEELQKASPGVRKAYKRIQAAVEYEKADDDSLVEKLIGSTRPIEWGDHGECGGINCEGGISCSVLTGALRTVESLSQYAPRLDFDRKYGNGEHIMCADGMIGWQVGCVTLRNVDKPLTGKSYSA